MNPLRLWLHILEWMFRSDPIISRAERRRWGA